MLGDESALELPRVLTQRGMDGLYSASLVPFAAKQAAFLEQSVELGRSFVQRG